MSFLTRAVSATKLALQAKGPTIMVVSGVASMGAATILAGKQTLKVEEVLTKHTPDLEKIQKGTELKLDSYPEEVARQDRFRVYTRVSLDMVKLYAVPGVLFIGGACLVFGGHRIMVRRNATLAVAFTALSKSFEQYRERVREVLGEEAEQELRTGGITTTNVETGEETRMAKSSQDVYNRIFEQGASTQWEPDLGLNKQFLYHQRKFAQEKLNRQGHLYLSDVYEALGFEESDVSRVVGWKVVRNPDGSKEIPMVDFGLDRRHPSSDFLAREHAIYLDFNCQGLIVGGKLQKILEKS
jgi:hypothetical protein